MTSIPGVPLVTKIHIQQKIDKIVQQYFKSPCAHYVEQTSGLHKRIFQSVSSSQMCSINAKLSMKFKYKQFYNNKLNYLSQMETFLNSPQYLMRVLYKNFTHDEIVILLNNIEVFVKNEYVRSFFPKIKKETIEEIFNKSNETQSNNKETELLPIIMPTDYKNKLMPEFNQKMQRRINNIIHKERNKIHNKHMKDLKARRSVDKIIYDMEFKINNIENYSNKFIKKHPIVEYYMQQKHNHRLY